MLKVICMKDTPNILLIIVDTLRKDVLAKYNGTAVTPCIDNFSKDAVIFKNPVSPSPWTVPSHMSIFTGLYAGKHNVHEDFYYGDKNTLDKMYKYRGKTIVDDLKGRGYNTVGFSANPWLSPNIGFIKNFNSFTFYSPEYLSADEIAMVNDYRKKYGKNRKKTAINLMLKGNIKELKKYYNIYKKIMNKDHPYRKGADLIVNSIMDSSYREPFFMFINFMEVHDPVSKWELNKDSRVLTYMDILKKKTIPEKIIDEIRMGYKKSLNAVDLEFGKLMNFLKNTNKYENTLIILTSDHGQALKEPYRFPYYGHGNFLYNEIIEVPLIIKFPENRKIEQKEGYQSLTGIPDIIKNAVEKNFEDTLTNDVSFSESFGPVHDIDALIKNRVLPEELDYKELIREMFYPKKAVYKKNYKLVINGIDGNVDEFTFKNNRIDIKNHKEIFDDLVNELYNFRGNERFQLP